MGSIVLDVVLIIDRIQLSEARNLQYNSNKRCITACSTLFVIYMIWSLYIAIDM